MEQLSGLYPYFVFFCLLYGTINYLSGKHNHGNPEKTSNNGCLAGLTFMLFNLIFTMTRPTEIWKNCLLLAGLTLGFFILTITSQLTGHFVTAMQPNHPYKEILLTKIIGLLIFLVVTNMFFMVISWLLLHFHIPI